MGHDDISGKRKHLDKEQVFYGEIGQQRQKVEIRRCVVAKVMPDSCQATTTAEFRKPDMQELPVVIGLKWQEFHTRGESKHCDRQQKQKAFRGDKINKCFPFAQCNHVFPYFYG